MKRLTALSEEDKTQLIEAGKRFERLRLDLGYKFANDFAPVLGELLYKLPNKLYDAGSISKIENGRMAIPPKLIVELSTRFRVNPRWLTNGEEPMYLENLKRQPSQMKFSQPEEDEGDTVHEGPTGFYRNARPKGQPIGEPFTTTAGAIFQELSTGKFLMSVPVVNIKARAGFAGGGYGDPEFVESLPKKSIEVESVHKGDYLWFDIDGDSMNDGTIENAIPSGSSVLTRNIKMDLWRSQFHYKQYKSFVIVHKTDGIFCKAITHHDVEKGIITCHSINPNKRMYPDFTVYLDDCLQIRNVLRRDLNDSY